MADDSVRLLRLKLTYDDFRLVLVALGITRDTLLKEKIRTKTKTKVSRRACAHVQERLEQLTELLLYQEETQHAEDRAPEITNVTAIKTKKQRGR